jgi:hypothetical protein
VKQAALIAFDNLSHPINKHLILLFNHSSFL